MAKIHFHYSTMNAGKTTALLQASHNYRENDMETYLITAAVDDRAGKGKIASRIGISADADTYDADSDLFAMVESERTKRDFVCVFVEEAQFLSEAQVWQLSEVVDKLGLPVMCYGLLTDFQGKLFEGSATLVALADEMREVRTICRCGKKATMVLRLGPDGTPVKDGPQVQIGDQTYKSVCRKHWKEAML